MMQSCSVSKELLSDLTPPAGWSVIVQFVRSGEVLPEMMTPNWLLPEMTQFTRTAGPTMWTAPPLVWSVLPLMKVFIIFVEELQ